MKKRYTIAQKLQSKRKGVIDLIVQEYETGRTPYDRVESQLAALLAAQKQRLSTAFEIHRQLIELATHTQRPELYHRWGTETR